MAIINCPECNGKVSDKAVSCPHCGFPIEKYIMEMKLEKSKEVAKETSKPKRNSKQESTAKETAKPKRTTKKNEEGMVKETVKSQRSPRQNEELMAKKYFDDAFLILYKEMKSVGRIGFLFTEHRKLLGCRDRVKKSSVADMFKEKEKDSGFDKSLIDYTLKDYTNKVSHAGFKKYRMKDILKQILPKSLICDSCGNENDDSYEWEGLFVADEDVDEFEKRIEESKNYIKYKHQKNGYAISYEFDLDEKNAIYIEMDDLLNGGPIYGLTRYDPVFEESKTILKQQVRPEYAMAEMTLNLKPTKPVGAVTSGIIGHALAGNLGAVYGYAKGKENEEKYKRQQDEYLQREMRKQAALKGPKYETVNKKHEGYYLLINLPFAPIYLNYYNDKILRIDILRNNNKKMGVKRLEAHKVAELQRYRNMAEYCSFVNGIDFIDSIMFYETDGGDMCLSTIYDDYTVCNELYLCVDDQKLYINDKEVDSDIRYYFYKSYYYLEFGENHFCGYSSQEAWDLFTDKLCEMYGLAGEDPNLMQELTVIDDYTDIIRKRFYLRENKAVKKVFDEKPKRMRDFTDKNQLCNYLKTKVKKGFKVRCIKRDYDYNGKSHFYLDEGYVYNVDDVCLKGTISKKIYLKMALQG